MDSGNSGSLQSSSGGDEEFDSRAEPMHPFLHSSATAGGSSLPNTLPPRQPPPPPTSLFDTLSYLDNFPRPLLPNTLLNLDPAWAHALRPSSSETDCTGVAGLIPRSPSNNSPSIAMSIPRSYSSPPVAATQQPVQPSEPPAPPRSSKKRSRASRRAPTTVLTTDTTNFRAMVQEFTGIPAPPFAAASSPFSRSRLDLFHTAASSSRPSFLPVHMAPPPYPLRPFPQKAQGQSFGRPISSSSPSPSSSSSIIDAFVSSTSTTTNSNANANTSVALSAAACNTNPTSPSNYQLPSHIGLGNQHQSLSSMQNPIFTFQSLLQSPINNTYSLPTAPTFASKPQAASTIPTTSTDFSVQLGDLQNLVGTGGMHQAWADGEGSQRGNRCKVNYSATSVSPDLHAEKGSESAPARGEGIVDSWLCSSD